MAQKPLDKLDYSTLSPVTQEEFIPLMKKHMDYLSGRKGGMRLILKFRDLRRLDFSGIDLKDAEVMGSCLAGMKMTHGVFSGTNFFNCDMRDADLSHADFSE